MIEVKNFEETAKELKVKIRNTFYDHMTNNRVDPIIQSTILSRGVLSGSAISSIYLNEKINDYDIYFMHDHEIMSVKEVFKGDAELQKQIEDWNSYDDNQDIPVLDGKTFTDKAITLKHKIQFIIMGTLDQCRPTFDFMHCMPYYNFDIDMLVISPRQLWSIQNKTLVFNPKRDTPPTFERIEKFKKRGWKIDPKTTVITQNNEFILPQTDVVPAYRV